MNCSANRLILLLAWPLVSAQAVNAQTATYYVSTTGSDANPGTAGQPFRTLTYAYSLATAGTTILVAPGTYTDYYSGTGLYLYADGTAANPIVLRSLVRGGAILDGQFASDRHYGIYLDGSYNILDGFVITRSPITGIYVAGNANQILNDEIFNNGTQGASDPEGQGIYSAEDTSSNVYEGNYVHDNGYPGSNLDHGLYLCGQNEVVANNVVIRHPSRGLQIAGYTTVSNMMVYNNLFAYNGADGITVWMAVSGVDIRNNICFDNGRNGIEFYAATGNGVTVDNNLVYGNAAANYSFTDGSSTVAYTLGTTLSADPLLANETQANFDAHLTSGSPAIGVGYNLSPLFATDLAGTLRLPPAPAAWDLGPYAYSAAIPTVMAAASTLVASRVNLTSGAFTLSRTGSTVLALTVNFALTGTATNGVDYAAVSGSATIPAGASSVTVPIAPLSTSSYVGAESAILTFSASAAYAYTVSAIGAAVIINGNGLTSSLNLNGSGVKLTWNSVAGKTYRVAYKTSLTDAAWTTLGGSITALGAATSYTDTTAAGQGSRFYVVFVTN